MIPLRPPPNNSFKPAGEVQWASLTDQPPFSKNGKRKTGRRRLGVKYEEKVHQHFRQTYGYGYFPSQWLKFRSLGGALRWCQCDGLIIEAKRITIVEVKYNHTFDAWYQLFQLYLPVVQAVFKFDAFTISCLEVVKWFDPAVAGQPKARLCERPELAQPGQFEVMIYNP